MLQKILDLPTLSLFFYYYPVVDKLTASYYEEHAQEVYNKYTADESAVASFFPFLFQKDDTVLDIGCASGQDLLALLNLGIDAYGIEPSKKLTEITLTRNPSLSGRIFTGSLPDMIPRLPTDNFDGVCLTAVLMHIPDSQLFDTAYSIRSFLKPNGKLLLSYSTERDDVIDSKRDKSGRLMILRSPEKIRLLFERIGFELTGQYHSRDVMGRNISWISQTFQYTGEAPRPLDRIEAIINRDRKVATYKLALFRALCDIAQTEYRKAKWDHGQVGIKLEDIAEKWIRYYWSLMQTSEHIPQISGEARGTIQIAFRKQLQELVNIYRNHNGFFGLQHEIKEDSISTLNKKKYRELISKIKNTIKEGPVTYSGGALGECIFQYDNKSHEVIFDDQIWRELVLMGHWIRDALILRWGELTHRISFGEVSSAKVIELLQSGIEMEGRDVKPARDTFSSLEDLECVWSGKRITTSFDIDHAIPFSFWQSNALWNLFPANQSVNNKKRDKLPTLNLINKRKDIILYYWEKLKYSFPNRFLKDAEQFSGTSSFSQKSWELELFSSFKEALEYTANLRGVERWEP